MSLFDQNQSQLIYLTMQLCLTVNPQHRIIFDINYANHFFAFDSFYISENKKATYVKNVNYFIVFSVLESINIPILEMKK